MKQNIINIAIIMSLILAGTGIVQADNVSELLKSAKQNYEAGKYSKALEDLEWAKTEISNLHLQAMKKLLPEELEGMKGMDGDGGAIFGIQAVSKEYHSADGSKSVTITLASGQSSKAGGGLGALMGMAAAMGAMDANRNSKMIIEQGYKGQFSVDPNTMEGTLLFNLNGGSMINIETSGYADAEMAQKAAKKLDIAKIEAAF